MHNWGVNTKELQKDKDKFSLWKLEQLINFGTDGAKISEAELLKYWDCLHLDLNKKRFLGFLLWGKKFLQKTS
jgi:hypothetical protein